MSAVIHPRDHSVPTSPAALRWQSLSTLAVLAIGAANVRAQVPPAIPDPVVSWNGTAPTFDNRLDHALAFDAARGVTVMFGGRTSGIGPDVLGDTWTFDGTNWSERSVSPAPSPRIGHTLTYDSVRQRVVLFGGQDPSGVYLNDTWEWNGTSWTQISTAASPSVRSEHSAAFRLASGSVVLFGGSAGAGTRNSETWTYNGTNWTQVATATSPSARTESTMAYDAPRQVVMMFGGEDAMGPNAQTWEFNGTNWIQQSPAMSPPARFGHASVYRSVGIGLITVNGGENTAGALGDAWDWDGSAKTWTAVVSGPSARFDHAMAFDSSTLSQAVLVGGGDATWNPRNDTWAFDGFLWTMLDNGAPAGRVNTAMCGITPTAGVSGTLLFGGLGSLAFSNSVLSDTWVFDGTQWVEQLTFNRPAARSQHALARRNTAALLFGGVDVNGNNLGDTWRFDGTNWALLSPSNAPSSRRAHAMAFDADRGRTVLFGGFNGTTQSAETWEFDGVNWSQVTPPTSPPARQDHVLIYDPSRNVTVLFGGGGAVSLNDTWEFDGTTWTQRVTAISPPGGGTATGGFDPMRNRIVLHVANGGLGETWEYEEDPSGTATWIQRSPSPAGAPQVLGAAALNPVTLEINHFGGLETNTGRHPNDVFEYVNNAPASVLTFGMGCPGSNGTPTLSALPLAAGLPWIGYSATVRLVNCPPNNAVILYYGLTEQIPPVDLTAFGLPGCFLYTSTETSVPRTADINGEVEYTASIPPLTSLYGANTFIQAFVADVPVGRMSNALRYTYGVK